MTVTIEHFNIVAPEKELEKVKQFYMALLELKEGWRPSFPGKGAWLYSNDVPVLHLSVNEDIPLENVKHACLDHVAFTCRGIQGFMERLKAMNVPYDLFTVPDMDQPQIFFKDPLGIKIELHFPGETQKVK